MTYGPSRAPGFFDLHGSASSAVSPFRSLFLLYPSIPFHPWYCRASRGQNSASTLFQPPGTIPPLLRIARRSAAKSRRPPSRLQISSEAFLETSLHRQLKEFYCDDDAGREVSVRGYRIDAIVEGTLVEIQQASLAALRKKTRALLETHDVIVVKPLSAMKMIVRLKKRNGPVDSRRTSPRHETIHDLFADLVHFVEVFPHPRLALEVLLTEQEETRIPKRKRWFRSKDYTVADRRLVAVRSRHVLRTAADLAGLLPQGLDESFTTADIARLAQIPRWLAQKMAYCLRQTGGITIAGKRRHAMLYKLAPEERAAA